MLAALFGLMDFMIIGKWLTDWDEQHKLGKQPPGVIMAMIVMFLSGGVYDKVENGDQWGDLIPNQTLMMNWGVLLAFICVPLMLLVKPCYYSRSHHAVHDSEDIKQSLVS